METAACGVPLVAAAACSHPAGSQLATATPTMSGKRGWASGDVNSRVRSACCSGDSTASPRSGDLVMIWGGEERGLGDVRTEGRTELRMGRGGRGVCGGWCRMPTRCDHPTRRPPDSSRPGRRAPSGEGCAPRCRWRHRASPDPALPIPRRSCPGLRLWCREAPP